MPKRTSMTREPVQVYGEPKFPVRMNYVTSEEQRKAVGEVAKSDGVTLGEAQRRLIEEALDMREQVAKADQEFAETEEGQERCRVVPVGLARVGDQLARQRPVGGSGAVPVMSRAQLMAQERGETD